MSSWESPPFELRFLPPAPPTIAVVWVAVAPSINNTSPSAAYAVLIITLLKTKENIVK